MSSEVECWECHYSLSSCICSPCSECGLQNIYCDCPPEENKENKEWKEEIITYCFNCTGFFRGEICSCTEYCPTCHKLYESCICKGCPTCDEINCSCTYSDTLFN